jgi:hypothetical protein
MFKSVTSRARTVATTGLIAALVVAGLAVAQGGGNSGSGKSNHRKAQSGKRMPPPPGGPLGKVGKDLTYGQLHVQRNGEAQTIRIDAGEVVSTSDSSITVKENDGNEVTISVDDGTKVLTGPGKDTVVTDLKAGQHVVVCGPEGEAAKTIALPPKRGKMPRGQQGSQGQGQLPPPPPGGQFGGPEGGPGQMQG